jgi:DNA-binding NarL/FixJ family response regulator
MTACERILIADDEETFLYSTAELLRRAGYACECAHDAASAAEKLQAGDHDLLIADIKMPGNPDLELIRALPQLARGLPVILITGYPTLRSAVQSIQLPVVAYLTKPLDFDELLAQVRSALEQSSAYRAVRSLRQRLREWGQDLQGIEQVMATDAFAASAVAADTVLALAVRNLVGCLGDLKPVMETHTNLDPGPQTTPRLADTNTPSMDVAHGIFLTHREQEIVRLLCTGQRVPTIARSLYLSPHTVRNHLKAVFRKVGVRSQIELLELLNRKHAAPAMRLASGQAPVGI